MTAILALLPIFGFATIFHIYFKRIVSVSIFFSITSIISILFLFGMFELLKIGSFLLFYGGIIILLFMSITYKTQVLNAVKGVPFTIFTITSIIYLYIIQDAQFFFWDEFSHWGAFIKEMYYFHHFYDASSVAANLSYHPGISIWDYFIVLQLGFSEGTIYFAYFLILFSSTLMMYEKLSYTKIYWIALVFVIQMVIFANFGHGFSSIYVDHIVGAMFAGLVLSYISDKFSKNTIYLFIFPLIALSLVKEVGLILCILFLFFILIMEIIKYRKNIENIKFIALIIQNKKIFITIFILFISILISFKSWNIRQESKGIIKNGITINKIIDNLSKDVDPQTQIYKDEIHNRFYDVFMSQQVHKNKISLNYNEFSYAIIHKYTQEIKLSAFGIFIFILTFFILIYYYSDKHKRDDVILINMFLLIVFVCLSGLLYISYLNGFGNDGLRIPSYVRYINTAILPILLIQFSLLLPMFDNKNKSMKRFNVALVVIITLVIITKPYFNTLYSQLENGFRKSIDSTINNILLQIPPKSKLFVVFPIRNNGSLNNILKYSLIPAKSTISKFDFEKKSSQEMIKIYSDYDFVWFTQLNETLFEKNKHILRGKTSTSGYVLYKIEIENKNIKFIPIL